MRRSERPGCWVTSLACVICPLSVIFTRRSWSGQSNVPRQGPAILVANHVCVLDPLSLAHFVYSAGRVPRFMATSGLWQVVGLRRVLRGAGQIPVYRDSANAATALRDAVTALHAGKVLVIYPEGGVTRDPDYWPMRADPIRRDGDVAVELVELPVQLAARDESLTNLDLDLDLRHDTGSDTDADAGSDTETCTCTCTDTGSDTGAGWRSA